MAEMFSFFLLVMPLPINIRLKMLTFVTESSIAQSAQVSLKFTFFFILILFVDSVNRVYRVQQELINASESTVSGAMTDRSEIQARRFYAQRNMYLCGFTLFLSLILNRVYLLVLENVQLKQQGLDKKGSTVGDSDEIARLQKIIKQKDMDIAALKKQSDGLSKEYYKVSDELNEKSGLAAGDKKHD